MKSKRPAAGRLTNAQQTKLLWHLQNIGFEKGAAEDLVWSLATWLPAALRGEDEDRRAHFARIAALTAELGSRLTVERPLVKSEGIDWDVFDVALARVRESAAAESGAKVKKRGRRSEAWRDELLALVVSQFPGPLLKRHGGKARLEETAGMLFEFLRIEVGDLRSTVRDILKRKTPPPFTVRRT